ncbi:FTH1 [Lepeophtheirus salmonis]|uniref:Ferritin n=1 Tax=Lepeophtheirus salmonis TaxID=72036 RepID=C1BSZ4_LEPSM|nr:ferritin heavy chain B-like [Lepeophtheirus salmonis]ACO12147.1 Ferritin heavy chain 1 [Lepeophtheirus salmonis]ADD38124.1 Ferritin heavy chain 1 [Lepeophtheirus salmonis]ADD38325.1 Ferritin heavy chain 1 [Lepeophtheirus salmonis]CAB4054559.1 FTH1 [Lepeophtheirus salmonis]CAF2758928.1 FTH1 [Lepeophtheirus salmonis]
MSSQIRQNYDSECEALINKQINMELFASYTYLSMGAYFSRDDVALEGFAKFFYESSSEENTHARNLINYQTLRGGRVVFQDISRPNVETWASPVEAMEAALQLEKDVNASLLNVHGSASKKEDPQLCDFLESDYLKEQVDGIKKIGTLLTRMKRVGPGVGMHLIDQELLKE